MEETFFTTSLVIFGFVNFLFGLSVVIKRNDIADIAWGMGIFLVAIISFLISDQAFIHSMLLIVAGLWGVRLSIRILLRNLKKTEDYRYKKWREQWGGWFYVRSYFQVYILQGLLMLVVGYPFVHASVYGVDFVPDLFLLAGLLVWGVGYFFEVVGDFQLDRFLKNPNNKGKIMKYGLWKYSRHPNYFGEVTMWWGIWLMILVLPMSWVALVSPLMITFLILKVSGIPLLEEVFANNPEFQEYKKFTSAFFPLPPKNHESSKS
jgi:steroid 5-alpha reductase family enzyme